jgi:3-oxoacyl-[acyl-carrier-protein] synthase-3
MTGTGGALYIHGLGHFHPSNVIDNSFLESLDIGIDTAWVNERVGISERRTSLDLNYIKLTRNRRPLEAPEAAMFSSTEMGCRAATLALARANLSPQDIGMVISGGCVPEFSIPSEASRIAATLGIEATTFEMTAACTSFIVQISYLNNTRPEHIPDFVLLVSSEFFTRVVDYSDRRTAVLFGDGATAAIVSAKHPARYKVSRVIYGSNPSGCGLISIPTGGHFSQEGNAVQRFAVRRSVDVLDQLQEGCARLQANSRFFIGHQANLRMLEAVCRRSNINDECHKSNVGMFGNCGAAGAPSVWSQYWHEMQESIIDLVQVGAGLSWGGLRIRPEYSSGRFA